MESKEENSDNKNNKKKTRDLPNLTECHSCGYRIDSFNDNGKNNNRLQTLYSEWRVVLLCKLCFFRVESSHLCSYCFKGSSFDNNNYFHCGHCKRIIHKSCFSNYSNFSPWSFSFKFSVCVDCWLPKSIAAKRAWFRSKKRSAATFSANSKRSRCNLPEGVVRDDSSDVQAKFEAAARAKELAVEKALVARKASELVHNASDLVSYRDGIDIAVVEDMQLALRLCHSLNSSPRILNNRCSVSSARSYPPMKDGVCRIIEMSHGERDVDPSVSVRVSVYDSSLNMDSLGLNGIDDGWMRQVVNDSELSIKEGGGSCSGKLMNSESQSRKEEGGLVVLTEERYNEKPDRCLLKYYRRASADKRYNGKPNLYLRKYARRTSAYEKYDTKPGRYLKKYSRRRPADKIYNWKSDRYSIKYARRKLNQRLVHDNSSSNCHDANEFSAGLTPSCSKEIGNIL